MGRNFIAHFCPEIEFRLSLSIVLHVIVLLRGKRERTRNKKGGKGDDR